MRWSLCPTSTQFAPRKLLYRKQATVAGDRRYVNLGAVTLNTTVSSVAVAGCWSFHSCPLPHCGLHFGSGHPHEMCARRRRHV